MSEQHMNYEPEVIVKKKGGLLGKLIALLLGIIIGIIAGIGGLAGGIFYAYKKMKLNQAFNLVTNYLDPNFDYTQYINGKYGEQTVAYLVGDAKLAIDKIANGTGTLNTLNEISPYVETLIKGDPAVPESGLVYLLSTYGVTVDGDEMMKRFISKPATETELYPDKYLTDYITDAVYSMNAGDLIYSLAGTPVDGIMRAICYGVEGVDYTVNNSLSGNPIVPKEGGQAPLTINDFMQNKLDGRIDALPLDSLLDINLNDSIMTSLAYGADHRYTIVTTAKGKKVEMDQLYYILETTEDGTETLLDDMHAEFTYTKFEAQSYNDTNGYILQFTDDEGVTQTQYLVKDPNEPAHLLAHTLEEGTTPTLTPIKFKKTTVGSLDNANDLINCIYLKDAMNITGNSEKFLISLAYGVEDIDYEIKGEGENKWVEPIAPSEPRTIRDLREKGGDLINEIYLSDIVEASPDDKLVMYMLYGKEGLHYEIGTDGKPDMLQEQVAVYNNKVYNEYGDVELKATVDLTSDPIKMTMTETGKEFILQAKGTEKTTLHKDLFEDGTGKVEAQTYLVFTQTSDGLKEVEFDHTHLGDLKGKDPALFSKMKNRLTISDVLGADSGLESNKILKHLQDETIADLPDAVANLTVGQVFENDIYKTTEVTEGDGENAVKKTYFIDKNDNLLEYNDAYGKYYIKGTQTESERVLKGSWKYLLTETADNGTKTLRLDYKIAGESKDGKADGMSAMMDNMTKNIQDASLLTLVDDEIILLDSAVEEKLRKEENQLVASMTISELINTVLQ